MQVLYALDSRRAPDAPTQEEVDLALEAYWSHMEGPVPGRAYGDAIVRGVVTARTALDDAIRAANPTWRVERMARVDRNVIRMATWEMLHGDDVPMQVAIDEAIELARRFGGEESPAFVNGTLDKIASMHGKARTPR